MTSRTMTPLEEWWRITVATGTLQLLSAGREHMGWQRVQLGMANSCGTYLWKVASERGNEGFLRVLHDAIQKVQRRQFVLGVRLRSAHQQEVKARLQARSYFWR